MATNSSQDRAGRDRISVIIVHGPHRYTVIVPEDTESEDSNSLQLRHLVTAVEKASGVPSGSQKLIFKGKSLVNQDAKLADLGLKNGSKIMLLGKKFDPESDENMKHLEEVERCQGQLEARLTGIVDELDGIHKGFLSADLHKEAKSKLTKRLILCTEESMRLLEKMDSLSLQGSCQEVKTKRKSLTNKIQAFLDRCDGIQQQINRKDDLS